MIKRFLFHIIPIVITGLLLTGIPVYATENQPAQQQQQQQTTQQQAEQAAQQQQQQAEQAAQQQQAQQQAEQAAQQAQQQAARQQTAEQQTVQQQQTSQQQTAEQQNQQSAQPAAASRTTTRTTATTTTRQQEEAEAEEEDAEDDEEEGEGESTSEKGAYSLKLIKNANMREEPSTDSQSQIVIPFGITISATEKATNDMGETWYLAEYGGYTGYIRGDMADVTTVSTDDDEDNEGEEGAEEQTTEAVADRPGEGVSKRSSYKASTAKKIPVTINKQYNSENYVSSDVVVEPREKVDLIFILFLVAAVIGCVFTFMMFTSLRAEYKRYRRNKLSKEHRN